MATCPITKSSIKNPVTALDGFTYERDALLKYVRKHQKSPITKERIDIQSLLEDINSNAENMIEKARNQVKTLIQYKRQIIPSMWDKVDESISATFISTEDKNYVLHIESTSTHVDIQSIVFQFAYMYFKCKANKVYYVNQTHSSHNDKRYVLSPTPKDDKIEIKWFISFTREKQAEKWLSNITSDEILSSPLRCILQLQCNQKKDFFTVRDANRLNVEQARVLKEQTTVQVVEGPPGTGKSTVITELINCYNTTNTLVLIISEKNQSLEAVVEKLENKDHVLCVGSIENMGKACLGLTLEAKVERKLKTNAVKFHRLKVEEKIKRLSKELKITHSNGLDSIEHCILNMLPTSYKDKVYLYYYKILQQLKKIEHQEQTLEASRESTSHKVLENISTIIVTFGSLHKVKDLIDERPITVIIDEASTLLSWQVLYLEHVLKGQIRNMHLFGDTRQLSPFWPSKDEQESILDISKHFNDSIIQLKKQYRMPDDIMDFLNKHFYNGILESGKSNKNKTLKWVNVVHKHEEESNDPEIFAIKRLLKKFDINKVIILTPYRKQVERIEEVMNTNVNVLTIDQSQGHESDVVFISLVKETPSKFLTNKRLCVLLSRVKTNMFIVGNRVGSLRSNNKILRSLAKI